MFPRRATFGVLAALLVTIPPQSAPPGQVRPISTHWAGYVDTGGSFTAVQAAWVQPRVRCERPNSSASFWIGLGGATATTQGLEQIGTSADCSENFLASYSAWYELIPVPARPVQLPLTVAAGDRLSAKVGVQGATVTLAIRNLTTGKWFSTRKTVRSLDLSTAEWIAEAPASCVIECTLLPLADFGSVAFTEAAVSAGAHTGAIDDPAWRPQRMQLVRPTAQGSAFPTPLSRDGRSFSIGYR
jgi:hypothetical protein